MPEEAVIGRKGITKTSERLSHRAARFVPLYLVFSYLVTLPARLAHCKPSHRGGGRFGRYGEKYYAIAIKRKIQSANGRGILIKPPLYCRLFIDKRTRNEGLYRLV